MIIYPFIGIPFGASAVQRTSARRCGALRSALRGGLLLSGSAGVTLATLATQANAQSPARGAQRVAIRSLPPAPVVATPSAARVAIERARQLEAQGIPSLAAVQFREAVAQAPRSLDAARELARFYVRQERWEEAADAWRQVLRLKSNDAEATMQIRRAQAKAQRSEFALGSQSDDALTDIRGVAQTAPRLSQAPGTPTNSAPLPSERVPLSNAAPDATTPDFPTSDTTAPAVEAPATDATAPDATAPDDTAPATTGLNSVPDAAVDIAPPAPDTPAIVPPVLERPAPERAPLRPAPRPVARPAQRPASAPAFAPPRAPAPAPVAASQNVTVTAIPFRNPAKVSPRVSRVSAAKAWPLVNRAAKELNAGRTQNALRLYQQATAIDPTNAYALPGVGTSYIVLGRFTEAAATYRRFLAIQPGDAKALRGLADALTYGQKYREALGVNNAILARSPRDFASAYQNGQIATYLRAYTQSDRFFNIAANVNPGDPNVQAAWGESLSYRRDARAVTRFRQALALKPGFTRALIGLGNFYSYTGQFQAAIPQYRAALRLQSGNTATQIALADALTYAGQQDAAVPFYKAALRAQPTNRAARLGLGRALVYAGNSREGANELRRVLSNDPGNTPALEALALAQTDFSPRAAIETYQTLLSRQPSSVGRARILASIGDLQARGADFSAAIQSYSQAARLAPGDPKINLGYAQLLASQEQFERARPVVESVLARQSNNAQALALQVQIENRTGNTQRAQELAARLENVAPANVDEALALAEALRATGNTASANRVLERAVSTVNDPQSALRLADATRDAGDYAGATALYQRILKSNPGAIDARLSLAETLIYQRDLDAARAQVGQVLAIDPQNVQAKVLTATIALRADTPSSREAAASQAQAILATDPNNSDARVIVGEVLTSRQQFAAAVSQFQGAVQADPTNLEARLGLARSLNYSRDAEGAITQYRELIRRLPTDTLPRLELAQIYLDRNRFSDAEALYNEVLALRRGLGASATARWKVETRAYAKLNPLAKLNSPLRSKARRRVVVDAPQVAPVSTKKGQRRVYLAQTVVPGTGTVASAASGTTPSNASGPGDATIAAGASGANSNAPAPTDAVTSAVPDGALSGTGQTTPDDAAGATSLLPPVAASATPDLGASSTTPAPNGAAASTDVAVTDQTAALRGLGEIRRRQGRFGEALEFFNQALSVDANDTAARVGVAQSLRGQNRYAPALEEVNRVLSADSANLPARVLRAQLLGDTGQPQQAQQELDALVASLPDNAPLETYLTLTQAFNTLQNYPASLQLLEAAAALYPQEPTIPRLRAETLTFARRNDEALAIYNQLIAADPQDADATLGKARVFNYSNQLEPAETTYRQVLALQPDNYQATTELADVLGRRANYPAAIALYQSAIQANPTDVATRVELARVQRFAGNTSEAEATLTQVIDNDARNVSALTERGVLRGTLGSFAPAIADLNAALAVSPTDLNAQLGLAEVQGYAGNYDASIQGYRTVLERDAGNTRARTQLASVLSYAGRTDEALREVNTVLAANASDPDARLIKADILGRAPRTAEAVALYNQILASDPSNVRARTGLADAYLYGRQYPNAVRVYDALIAADPTNTTFQIQRARALGYGGRAREAVVALRRVVAAEPNNVTARLALAEAGTNSGNPTLTRDAIAEYRSILRADNSNVPAQVGLGRALSYVGSYGESQRLLNAVLASNPGNADARYALAESQRFQGKTFAASDNYRAVLATQPNNTLASSGLRATRRDTAPRLTAGGSYYSDTNGVRLRSVNYGATLPTRAGTIGVIAENGRFSQNGVDRDRNALSLLLARAFGPVQARLVLTRLKYDGAPNRTLYDLLLNNVRGPRQRYYLGVARRDIFESDAAVARGITATLYRAGFAYPLANKIDFEGQLIRYRYSDNNSRTSIQPTIYYRFRPTNPSLRVGLTYLYDDARQTRNGPPFLYYSPQNFNAASILADYVVDSGSTRYGVFGSVALTNRTGADDSNRPADTLGAFLQQDLSNNLELFADGFLVRTPSFRSNQVSGGVNLRF